MACFCFVPNIIRRRRTQLDDNRDGPGGDRESLGPSASAPLQISDAPLPSCRSYFESVQQLLETQGPDARETTMMLEAMQNHYPRPPTEIVPPSNWGWAFLSQKTHLASDFAMALSNAETATNTTLSAADQDTLRVLLTHWCRWSATYPSHAEDSWVRCLEAIYAKDNLKPILDTLFYEEELSELPPELRPTPPSMFLLANSQSYFLFVLDDQTFCLAGSTLSEVYDGLRNYKWHGDNDGDWPMEPEVETFDFHRYFPSYTGERKDGRFDLDYPQAEFPF
jgi:hypothetical protein